MKRGEIWWTDIGEPSGSEPGYKRPAVIVSSDDFNATAIKTVIVAFTTTNPVRARDPANVWLTTRQSGLPESSTVNLSQLTTLDKRALSGRVARLPDEVMSRIDDGLKLVLGLE